MDKIEKIDELAKLGRRLHKKLKQKKALSTKLKQKKPEKKLKPLKLPKLLKPFPQDEQAFIYILHCVGFDYYKIGLATNVVSRISVIQTGCPFEIKLIICKKVDKAWLVEKVLHKHLIQRKVRGEWYKLSEKEAAKLADSLLCFRLPKI